MSDFKALFHDDWMEVEDSTSGCCWSFVFEHDDCGHTAVTTPFSVAARAKLPDHDLEHAACEFAQHEAMDAGLVDLTA